MLESFQYQDYPLEMAVEELGIQLPKAVTSFNMLNIQETSNQMQLESFEPYHKPVVQDVKFDLTLFLVEYKNGMEMRWNYRKSLFTPGSVENIARGYIGLIDEITGTSDKEDT